MRYLYDKTEKIILEFDSEIFEHPYLSTGNRVISARKGEAVGPLHPGHYLIYEDTGKAEKQIRYLGVAGDHSVIMQLTVGVFTADTFDSVAHAKRVPLNYYIGPTQVIDSTFRGYEQDYGDAVAEQAESAEGHCLQAALAAVVCLVSFYCHDLRSYRLRRLRAETTSTHELMNNVMKNSITPSRNSDW